MELCGKCAAIKKSEGQAIKLIAGAANSKVTCEVCGRRRYGATYEVGGKDKKHDLT